MVGDEAKGVNIFTVRKDIRFEVQCPVVCTSEEKAVQGTTFNLSRGGCAIECHWMATAGETVSLQITVPGQEKPIIVELGRICWATRREFGVEFKVMPGDSKHRLDAFLIEVAKRNAS